METMILRKCVSSGWCTLEHIYGRLVKVNGEKS